MPDPALDLLQRIFGHREFRGEQAQIVEQVANGGDALVLMPTGGGKSLCYQLPALLREGPLLPATQYYVRLAASNEAGVRYSQDLGFQTTLMDRLDYTFRTARAGGAARRVAEGLAHRRGDERREGDEDGQRDAPTIASPTRCARW